MNSRRGESVRTIDFNGLKGLTNDILKQISKSVKNNLLGVGFDEITSADSKMLDEGLLSFSDNCKNLNYITFEKCNVFSQDAIGSKKFH